MENENITHKEALERVRVFLIGQLFALRRDAKRVKPLIKGVGYKNNHMTDIMLINNQIFDIINPALGLTDLKADIEGMPLFSEKGNFVISVGDNAGEEIEP
jgi:hypothetical protein